MFAISIIHDEIEYMKSEINIKENSLMV